MRRGTEVELVQRFRLGQTRLLQSALQHMNDWFADGMLAEYCTAPASAVAGKPERLSHAEAASVPISALTARQGLVDRAQV
jgi:NADPH:quinone reductase-like Zn-dependent oxidoreductase